MGNLKVMSYFYLVCFSG